MDAGRRTPRSASSSICFSTAARSRPVQPAMITFATLTGALAAPARRVRFNSSVCMLFSNKPLPSVIGPGRYRHSPVGRWFHQLCLDQRKRHDPGGAELLEEFGKVERLALVFELRGVVADQAVK